MLRKVITSISNKDNCVQAQWSGQLGPCKGLSESDSKLYTTIELCEGKSRKYFKNILI